MMTGFVLVSVTLFTLSTLAVMLFIGLWTYKDAQVKSEHSPVLWVLVVLLVPNMIGLIVYLMVGRSKKDVPAPKTFLRPLLASVAVFAISIVMFIAAMVWLTVDAPGSLSGNMAWNSGVWTNHRSHYSQGEWTVSARRGNGTMRRAHNLDSIQLESFRFWGSTSEGGLYIILDQDGTMYTIDISGNVMGDIDLRPLGFQPGRIRKTIRFDSARDANATLSWY